MWRRSAPEGDELRQFPEILGKRASLAHAEPRAVLLERRPTGGDRRLQARRPTLPLAEVHQRGAKVVLDRRPVERNPLAGQFLQRRGKGCDSSRAVPPSPRLLFAYFVRTMAVKPGVQRCPAMRLHCRARARRPLKTQIGRERLRPKSPGFTTKTGKFVPSPFAKTGRKPPTYATRRCSLAVQGIYLFAPVECSRDFQILPHFRRGRPRVDRPQQVKAKCKRPPRRAASNGGRMCSRI